MPSGIRGFSQRGYVKPLVIDDSNNISAAVGIETVNESFTSGNRAFLQMPVIASKTISSVKFDFYVDKSPNSNDTFSLQFRWMSI